MSTTEVQGPTDEELAELLYNDFTISTGHGSREDAIGFARAVLVRWGCRPTPPAPGEVRGLVEWLNMIAQHLVDENLSGAPHCQRAAILLEQQEAELAILRTPVM